MRVFGWIAERRRLPLQWDLRRIGWSLSEDLPGAPVWLVDSRGHTLRPRTVDASRCLFAGVDSARERVRLLGAGCGDAVPASIGLVELAHRARRVAERGDALPRRREIGSLVLDLLHRDARAGPRWLALHPREFALLWRLAEQPGERVSRTTLLRDVWRLEFEPGTNSVEVHVSRLRSKLSAAASCAVVETDPAGGYRLRRIDAVATPIVAPGDRRLCA